MTEQHSAANPQSPSTNTQKPLQSPQAQQQNTLSDTNPSNQSNSTQPQVCTALYLKIHFNSLHHNHFKQQTLTLEKLLRVDEELSSMLHRRKELDRHLASIEAQLFAQEGMTNLRTQSSIVHDFTSCTLLLRFHRPVLGADKHGNGWKCSQRI